MAQASLSSLSDFQVILVPGLHDSSFEHWQSRWQRAHPDFWRVRQDDWHTPDLRAWAAGLDQVRALDKRPALCLSHLRIRTNSALPACCRRARSTARQC